MIPENRHIEEEYHELPKCNIFMSPEFYQPNPELNKGCRALVLIQGTGHVRAGMWARSVCINNDFEAGSMLPFLRIAKKLGIPVLVMNPNYNRDPQTEVIIPNNHTMTDHAEWVWRHYVEKSGFDKISIVAHSAGGGCLRTIMKGF